MTTTPAYPPGSLAERLPDLPPLESDGIHAEGPMGGPCPRGCDACFGRLDWWLTMMFPGESNAPKLKDFKEAIRQWPFEERVQAFKGFPSMALNAMARDCGFKWGTDANGKLTTEAI